MCMYFEVERDDSLYLAFIVVIFMVWSNYHHACHVLLFLLPILHFTCVQILVKLIGFTTVEQKALYAQAKQMKSPAIKSRVLEGIQRCQRVLASLSCFLEISIALEREYPLVTQMREASSRDAEILLDNIRARLPNM
eukprot:scpid100459/ scgid2828/ 